MELEVSGSGDFAGSGASNVTVPNATVFFPCRHSPFSRNSTSPLVWSHALVPVLEDTRIYVAVIEGLLFLVGFVWNLFVLICYCWKPRLLKEPANVYLFNLAFVDLLLTIFITLTAFTSEATGEFIYGKSDFVRCNYCVFLGVFLHTFISMSLHTLAILSVDRFIALSHPLRYRVTFTWKKAVLIMAALWALSIAISLPPIFGFGEYEYNIAFSACNARWTGEGWRGIRNIYYVTFYSMESIIPIIILTLTNVIVIKIIRRVLKNQITRRRTYRKNSKAIEAEEEYRKGQRQLVKVFTALFIAHIVCWTPVLTVLFVSLAIGAENIPLQVFVAGWLAYLSIPIVHPIIESSFIKDLRYQFDRTKSRVRSSLRYSLRRAHSSVSSSLIVMRSRSRRELPPPEAVGADDHKSPDQSSSDISVSTSSPMVTANGYQTQYRTVVSFQVVEQGNTEQELQDFVV